MVYNRFYDQTKSFDTWVGAADLDFEGTFLVSINAGFVPLTKQTLVDINGTLPDTTGGLGAQAVYLVLRDLVVALEQDNRFVRGWREGVAKTFSVTVPNGGGTQTFQLPNSQAITALAFYSWSASSANLGVGGINVDRNDGNFIPVIATPQVLSSAGTVVVQLTQQFGPYGFEALAATSGGLRAQLSFFNSTGSSQTLTFHMTGSEVAMDLTSFFIYYISPAGTQYQIASYSTFLETKAIQFPLSLRMPFTLPATGNSNFGSIGISVVVNTFFYQTSLNFDYVLRASLMYLYPVYGGGQGNGR